MTARIFPLLVAACACLTIGGAALHATEASVPELVGNLKSSDEAALLAAIDQLSEHGEQAAEAVGSLTALLKHSSAKVRAHAIHALGKIGAPAKSAVPALAELLKDPDDVVRRQIVPAIRAINPGPQVTIPLCVKLLEDSDPGVRVRILNTIAEAGAAAVPGLIEALKNDKAAYWACVVLRSIGPTGKDAVSGLAERLKDPRPQVRREAVLALGAMGEAAIPVLVQIAATLNDDATRTAATFVLGQLSQLPPGAETAVLANAKSKNPLLSTVSIWTIARVHPTDKNLTQHALAHLIDHLKDEDPFVREMAARALLTLPPAPELALPLWEKAFQNMDEATAGHALDALATLGPAAVPRLIDALKYENLRVQVIHVLGQIGPASAPATAALAKLIDDKNARVANEAVLALASIGPGAKDAVKPLAGALRPGAEANSETAIAVAYALGRIGPDAIAAEGALNRLLRTPDRNLAIVSAWAITQIRAPSADLAAKVTPVLVAGLATGSPVSRQAAAEALGSLGPLAQSAAAALKKASNDPEKEVRAAAAQALEAVNKRP